MLNEPDKYKSREIYEIEEKFVYFVCWEEQRLVHTDKMGSVFTLSVSFQYGRFHKTKCQPIFSSKFFKNHILSHLEVMDRISIQSL